MSRLVGREKQVKDLNRALVSKKSEFENELAIRKNIFITFVTTYGVKQNEHSNNIMDNQVKMDALFEKE